MSKTRQLISANCGKIQPDSISDYLNAGGYEGLKKAMTMTPDAIIDEIETGKLLGRGGAAYPACFKWRHLLGVKEFPK